MVYQEAIAYLYAATPVYQQIGSSAYKPGLDNVLALDAHYDHPHRAFETIHVGGTNGKGSTSHTLSAVLQSAGYKVGLFTSPHLVDFRERIRVNGEMISEEYVVRFTEEARDQIQRVEPSFFELTTMMALCYFRDMGVDIAIIEVGLGGRLDCTNIISPILSIITNISLDHTQYLGNTLAEIAGEKAGIIKPHTPIVVGNASGLGVRETMERVARERNAPLYIASESHALSGYTHEAGIYHYTSSRWGTFAGELRGFAQAENTATILTALEILAQTKDITSEAVAHGFAHVVSLTGLQGRWQQLDSTPDLICDTAHNEAGITIVTEQLRALAPRYSSVHIILGMAGDKDVRAVLSILPREAGYRYYFTRAEVTRSLPEEELARLARATGLEGETYPNVPTALIAARREADGHSLIFVGGSNFVVADLLSHTYHA